MRKLSLLAANLFLAAMVLFTSCKTEDDASGPSFNFLASDEEQDYVNSDATVSSNEAFMVGVSAQKGDANLETFAVSVSNNAGDQLTLGSNVTFSGFNDRTQVEGPVVELRGDDQDDFNTIISISAPSANGVYTYSFTLIDNDSETTVKTITITVGEATEVEEFSAKLLGAQGAGEGSYFSSSTGEVYTGSQFAANSSIIDITYAQTGATDLSISDKIISSAARESEGLQSGTGGLEVYYQDSDIDYYEASVEDIEGIDVSAGQVIDIEVGDVIEFMTENGNKGLIIVNDITNPDDSEFNGVLDISVKVLR